MERVKALPIRFGECSAATHGVPVELILCQAPEFVKKPRLQKKVLIDVAT